MKTLSTLLLLLFFTATMASISNETIYFDKASYTIATAEHEKLEDISTSTKIILQGHTDKDGDEKYNLKLSKNRVEAVKKSLIEQGIDERAIEINYFGESQPINTNTSESEMSLNRRVEIITTDDPLLGFYQEKQKYNIHNSRDTTIIAAQGTKIQIPAHAFDGAQVEITIQEYYTLEDILTANLNTHAGNELLETAGMIYIEAIDKNTGLPTQPSAPISITYTTVLEDNSGFQLFDGDFDDDMTMNWTVSNTASPFSQGTYIYPSEMIPESRESNMYLNYLMLRMSDQDLKNRLTTKLFAVNGVDFTDNNISYAIYEEIDGRVNFYENPQCFNRSRAIVSIDENGYYYEATTSHGETNIACDTIMKNELEKIVKLKKIPKELQSHSVDFIEIDLATDEEVQAFRDSIKAELEKNYYYKNLIASAETDALIFSTMNLGWINCDKFYRIKDATPLAIYAENGTQIRVIFKNINSIMTARSLNGTALIPRTPLNAEIIVLATKLDGETPKYAIFETKIGTQPITIDEYETMDTKTIKEKLKKLKS